jgi:hypothetical protein
MNPQLADVVARFESATRRLHALQARLSPDEWSRRPPHGGWSPIECIAHLNLTSEAFLPLLRDGIARARRSGRGAPSRYRRDFMGWLISRALAPPGRFKTATTPAFVPSADRPPADVLAGFERLQAEQIACAREADGLPVHRVRMASPFNSRVKYSLYSALVILPVHQHRHLWQAEQR